MKKIKTLPLPVEPAQEPEESWRVIDVQLLKCQLFIYVGPHDKFLDRLRDDCKFPDSVIKEISEAFEEDDEATTCFCHGNTAIWSAKPMQQSVLVHELFHAAVSMVRSRHLTDDEAVAYTLEYLYKEATK